MPTDPMPLVGSWALTYLLHSTLLLGTAWGLTRRFFREPAIRDLLWKTALVGGLITASVQLGLGFEPLGGALSFPGVRTQGDPTPASQGWSGMLGETGVPSRPVPAAGVAPVLKSGSATVTAVPDPTAPAIDVAPDAVTATGLGLSGWSGVVAVWLLIAAAWSGLYLLQRARAIRRLGDRSPVADHPLLTMLEQLRQAGGIQRPIRLTTAPGLTSPVALGGAEIALPEVALSELDAAQQRSMLAHELAHLARRDPAWLALACLLERALFLQPLNALARVRIQEAAEYLCDDWAVHRTGSGISLASCLVKVAEWVDVPRAVPLTGLAERRSQLVTRIHRLIEGRPMSSTPRTLWVLALAGGLLGLTAVAAPGITPARAATNLSLATPDPGPVDLTPVPQDSVRRPAASAVDTAQPADTNESWYRRLIREARAAQSRARIEARRALMGMKQPPMPPMPALAPLAPMPPIPPIAPRVWALGGKAPVAWSVQSDDRATDTTNIAVPALILALKDQEVEVRRAAAQSLANLRDPRAVPALIDATRDADAEVRASAVMALGEIGDRRAATALGQALKDPAKDVKRAAFNALAEMPNESVPDDLVLGAMADGDAELRQAALSLATNRLDSTEDEDGVRHASPRYVAAFAKLLGDSDADIRASAASALGEAGLHEAPTALLQAASDKSPDVREHVASALGEIRDPKSVPALKGMLNDPNSDVREQVVSALSEIRDQSALEALVGALKSSDGAVRRRAAEALGQRGGE